MRRFSTERKSITQTWDSSATTEWHQYHNYERETRGEREKKGKSNENYPK